MVLDADPLGRVIDELSGGAHIGSMSASISELRDQALTMNIVRLALEALVGDAECALRVTRM